MKLRCRFCHEYVAAAAALPAHEAEHLGIRADGQQNEYVTLPPEARAQGDLDDVPRVYRHTKCGAETEMPEEIVRSYLANPHLYNADETYCCGCGRHVPFRECTWTETGEDLQSYTNALRAAKREVKPVLVGRWVILAIVLFSVFRAVLLLQ